MKPLVLSLLLVLLAGPASLASGQVRREPWESREPPVREIAVMGSAWQSMNASGNSFGLGWTRNLGSDFAVEGLLELGRTEDRHFGVATVQLRAPWPETEVGFMTLGVAHAMAPRGHRNAPRGNTLTLGAGVAVPISPVAALRLDGKMLLNYCAVRVSVGVTIGLD